MKIVVFFNFPVVVLSLAYESNLIFQISFMLLVISWNQSKCISTQVKHRISALFHMVMSWPMPDRLCFHMNGYSFVLSFATMDILSFSSKDLDPVSS